MRVIGSALVPLVMLMAVSSVFAQETGTSVNAPVRQERRPEAVQESVPETQTQPNYKYFSLLDGLPMMMELHHDTEAGTGKPIDVYLLVIEMQVMNSDGAREPIGLQIGNFYTARAMDPQTAWNPNNAADCKTWYGIVQEQIKFRDPKSPTWPYIQLAVAEGARIVETIEDGRVWWSDDINCWGAADRFPPF